MVLNCVVFCGQDIKREKWVLTDEGNTYTTVGSPEAQLMLAIPPEGISRDDLQVILTLPFSAPNSFSAEFVILLFFFSDCRKNWVRRFSR